ncbi:MAG: tRNA (guanine(37)-N(1))-methyltransferase, partial [Desulfovibrio sp.]|nr:tRNA (guanine(37)-N(1))-methyltransferase [Desulfovibrio sp.]
MHFNIVTLFPEYFSGPLTCGLLGKACETGLLSFSFHNPRDAAEDKRRTVDGPPYGGGPGMVMLPGPLCKTLRGLGFVPHDAVGPGPLLLFKAGGTPFGQTRAAALAAEVTRSAHAQPLTLICGRYEGIDARIEELFPAEAV